MYSAIDNNKDVIMKTATNVQTTWFAIALKKKQN